MGLTGCDISISASPGSIEDRHKPKIDPELAPIPDGYFDFAKEVTRVFFENGREGVKNNLHPAMQNTSSPKWAMIEKIVAKDANMDAIEYYGHGFGRENGVAFVVIQLKVPFDGGYNLVKIVVPTDEECCRLAGLNITLEKINSISFGK